MKNPELPFHSMCEKGYAPIACDPISCARPMQIGKDPSAGHIKIECGINTINSLDSAGL